MDSPTAIANPPESADSVGCGRKKEDKSTEQRKRPEFTGTLQVDY